MKQNLWLRVGVLSVALVALFTAAAYLLRSDGDSLREALPDVIFFEDGSSSALPPSMEPDSETATSEPVAENSYDSSAGIDVSGASRQGGKASAPVILPPWETPTGSTDVFIREDASSREKEPSSRPARPSSSRPQSSSRETSSLSPPITEVIPPSKGETPGNSNSSMNVSSENPPSSQNPPESPSSKEPSSSEESSSPLPSDSSSYPEASAPESSSKPPPPSSGDNASQMNRENEAAAATLAMRYRVEVVLLRTGSYEGMTAAPESDPVRQHQALEEVTAALAAFPNSFFAGDVTLVLAGKLLPGGALVEKISGRTATYALSCAAGGFRVELTSRLAAFAAGCFTAEAAPDFSAVNPPDFFYGFPDPQYVYSPLNRANGYFLSQNAQCDMYTECQELMEAVLNESSALRTLPADSPLYTKVKQLCSAAVGWRGSLTENRVVARYLYRH